MNEHDVPAQQNNVALEAGVETISQEPTTLHIERGPDTFHWIDDEAIDISAVDVRVGDDVVQYASGIGMSKKLTKIANEGMEGRQDLDDALNVVMWSSIRKILSGNPSSVKKLQNAPNGMSIFYAGLGGSRVSRVYFADMRIDGVRTFIKVGLAGSKNQEPSVMKTLTGKKNEKV